jgi:hypothetical protein
MDWKDSALSLVSTIIGSGLFVFVGTTLYSTINQPNIALTALSLIHPEDRGKDHPRISYEIFAKNVGVAEAKNLTLSMFFVGNITNAMPVLYDENLTLKKELRYHEPSLIIAHVPRLARDAMIVIDVSTNKSYLGDSYYVSATYDQGSNFLGRFNLKDIQSRIFPDIRSARTEIPIHSEVILTAAIVAIVFFGIAFADVIKRKSSKSRPKLILNIFFILPLSVIGSIIVLVVSEELLLSVMVPSIFIPPVDITTSISLYSKIYYPDGRTSVEYLAVLMAIIVTIAIVIARSVTAYLIVRLAIKISPSSQNTNSIMKKVVSLSQVSFRKHGKIRLFGYSFLIVGIPFESILRLFVDNSVANISSLYLFMIMLVIDIIRMSILIIFTPRRVVKQGSIPAT